MTNRIIVTVIDNCATIVTADVDDYLTKFREVSYLNDRPGSYVRRWLNNGEAAQVFGGWIGGGSGNALTWAAYADEPADKARQIGREVRLPVLIGRDYRAWRATKEAEQVCGDLFCVYGDGEAEPMHPRAAPYVRPRLGLRYVDASGSYDVRRIVAPGEALDPKLTGYGLFRGETMIGSIVRPVHADSDTCEAVATALHGMLTRLSANA